MNPPGTGTQRAILLVLSRGMNWLIFFSQTIEIMARLPGWRSQPQNLVDRDGDGVINVMTSCHLLLHMPWIWKYPIWLGLEVMSLCAPTMS